MSSYFRSQLKQVSRVLFPKASLEPLPPCTVSRICHYNGIRVFPRTLSLYHVPPPPKCRFSWIQTLAVCLLSSKWLNFISNYGFHTFNCHHHSLLFFPSTSESTCLISSFSCPSSAVVFLSPRFECLMSLRWTWLFKYFQLILGNIKMGLIFFSV